MSKVDPMILTTGRGLSSILNLHDLTLSEFEGKVVLDLGCGLSTFDSELKQQGVDATVISVDGRFHTLESARTGGHLAIPAQAKLDALPIADESVDIVMATFSLPMWGQSDEEIRTFYQECRRIVRVGGLLSIYPIAVHEGVEYTLESRDLAALFGQLAIHKSQNWQIYRRDGDDPTQSFLLSATKLS